MKGPQFIIFLNIFFLSMAIWGSGFAQPLEYSLKNEISIRGAMDLRDDGGEEDTSFGRLIIRPQLELEREGVFNAKLSMKGDYIYAKNSDNDMDQKEVKVWDSYIKFKRDAFEFSLGNMIVSWGKADEFSPVDELNPQDLRELVFMDLDQRKRPIPMAQLKVYRGGQTLEFIVSPKGNHHKRDYFDTDWAVFRHYLDTFAHGPVKIKVDEDHLTYSLRDIELGMRWSFQIRDIDLALSYLYLHDRSPYPALKAPQIPGITVDVITDGERLKGLYQLLPYLGDLSIGVEYPRDSMFGLEFDTTLGPWGLRGEAVYHTGRVFLENNFSYCQKGYFQYIIGLDRFFEDNLYLNMQFFQQLIDAYDENIMFDPRVDTGFTLKFDWTFWEERFDLSLTGFYSLANEMWYVNPELTWKPKDNVYILFGIHSIYGDEGSYFDLYDTNSEVYIGLRIII